MRLHKKHVLWPCIWRQKLFLSYHTPPPPPLFSPDLARATSFWSLKFHLSGKGFTKCPWVCTLSVYDWRPFEEYEKCFQTWIDRLKGQRWVLWGHGRIKRSKINKCGWKHLSVTYYFWNIPRTYGLHVDSLKWNRHCMCKNLQVPC